MDTSANSGPSINIGVRLDPQMLSRLHQMAARQELTVSAAARHLMALGMQELEPAA